VSPNSICTRFVAAWAVLVVLSAGIASAGEATPPVAPSPRSLPPASHTYTAAGTYRGSDVVTIKAR